MSEGLSPGKIDREDTNNRDELDECPGVTGFGTRCAV